jgi:hypothetical protein
MMQIYNLLNSNIKKGNLKSIEYLIPEICKITESNCIFKELYEVKLIEWDNTFYNKKRIDNLSNDEFDMYTISWLPNQISPVHDHARYGCIMYLMMGTLEEKIYNKKLQLVSIKIYSAPYIGYIDNKIGFHSIKCIDKAVTLHIYSPGKHNTFLMSI